ncbi:hypothetical protein GCM10027589_47220 [Actinocorallia lasiicapitis]
MEEQGARVYGPQPDYRMPARRPGLLSARQKLAAAGAAVTLALGGGIAGAVGAVALTGGESGGIGAPVTVSGVAQRASISDIAKAVQPGVVSISAESDRAKATGSGVVLRTDGTIVTNHHVIAGASRITVKFSDGSEAVAKVVGDRPDNDLAVIKAQGVSGKTVVPLADSDGAAVGDTVVALGSPLGLDGSVTAGIVSAKNRTVAEAEGATITGALQTDAAINPGNSGGALVDGSGRLIGINTAIATAGGASGSIGVGFAIPSNTVRTVTSQILGGNPTGI